MKIEDLFDICMALLINFTKFELSKGKFLPYAKKRFLDHFSELKKEGTNLTKKHYLLLWDSNPHPFSFKIGLKCQK